MCKLSSAGLSCNRHTRAPSQAAPWHPSWRACHGHLQRGPARRGRLSAPRCPSGGMPVHPAQRSPGSGRDPDASWACTSANLALALATRGAEEQKIQRSLPFCKRQLMTPQKKTVFPSVSLQTNGRQGPSCRSNPEYPKGTLGTQDWRARCKPLPPTGRPSQVWFACWPSVSKWNSKSTDISAAMFRFLYTVHVCLPIVSVKKPLWIKSTSKTSYMITIL